MGMFDTILVHKSHIDSLVTDEELKNNWKADKKDLYYFQTKDLENLLDVFKVDKEGQLWKEKYLVEFDNNKKWPFKAEHTPLPDERLELTSTVLFYDSVRCEINDVWIDFEAVFYNGKLAEIKLVNLTKTNIAERDEKIKKAQERWNKVRGTWSWKLMGYIRLIERKCFYPIGKIYNNALEKLRKHGEDQYPIE